jgi:hypothetical protein
MTAYKHRVLLIVPAVDGLRANQSARSFDKVGAQGTFTIGLSPTGLFPVTHFWCCTQLSPATWESVKAIQAHFPGSSFFEFEPATEPHKPDALLLQLGLQRINSLTLGTIVLPIKTPLP